MLKISNLSKTYQGNNVKAVDDLSLKVAAGELFGFLGPNGAGKSTTIKAVIGVLPYEAGTIEVCGYDLKRQPIEAKKCIGYVPDNHVIYEKLTGIEYLTFMADVYGVSVGDRTQRIEQYATLFKMTDALSKQIKAYSHGMKQKICVIGSLLHDPKVWILDEPLTGLDPQSLFDLKELMRTHSDKGNAVLFSSHVLDVAEKLCDRIGIIKKSKLIVDTTMEELKQEIGSESLEEYFLRITECGH